MFYFRIYVLTLIFTGCISDKSYACILRIQRCISAVCLLYYTTKYRVSSTLEQATQCAIYRPRNFNDSMYSQSGFICPFARARDLESSDVRARVFSWKKMRACEYARRAILLYAPFFSSCEAIVSLLFFFFFDESGITAHRSALGVAVISPCERSSRYICQN